MIDPTRRRFLKWVGIGALASVVPMVGRTVKAGPLTDHDRIPVKDISIESRRAEFNPNHEYGRGAECMGMKDNFVLRQIHRDAKRVLPEGTPYELRFSIPSFADRVDDFGNIRAVPMMVWYYSPYMLREKAEGMRPDSWGEWSPRYGCWVRGRFYA